MGQLAIAAKITHVPSMVLSEFPGERHGTRQEPGRCEEIEPMQGEVECVHSPIL